MIDSPFKEWIPRNGEFPDDKAWDSKGRKRDVLCFTIESARLAFEEVGPFGRFFLDDTMDFDWGDEEEEAADGEVYISFTADIRVDYDPFSLR